MEVLQQLMLCKPHFCFSEAISQHYDVTWMLLYNFIAVDVAFCPYMNTWLTSFYGQSVSGQVFVSDNIPYRLSLLGFWLNLAFSVKFHACAIHYNSRPHILFHKDKIIHLHLSLLIQTTCCHVQSVSHGYFEPIQKHQHILWGALPCRIICVIFPNSKFCSAGLMPWFVRHTCQISVLHPNLWGVTLGSFSNMRSVCSLKACCSSQSRINTMSYGFRGGVTPHIN